ncbi:MAG: LUD domain-containing protein [Chitinophagaceae bacterium]|nr:LUD domain-containing protein [Chitinophagaceae bacterium]
MPQSSRENILSLIRKALSENSLPMPFPEADKHNDFYTRDDMGIEEKFAEEFSKLGGKFVYCADELEMVQNLQALADTMHWDKIHVKDNFLLHLFREHQFDEVCQGDDMRDIQVGLSLCECLVARTGSLIMSSAQDYGRALPVYAPVHIAIAFGNQLVWNISDAIAKLKEKYQHNLPSLISLTTGPSRTADIEKTLVVGVHGPKEVYVFLVDQGWKQ